MSLQSHYQLSIIIPVFNEVDNVEPLFLEIQSVLPATHFDFEVIFVDDCSTDGTVQTVKKLSEKYVNCHALLHKKNYGQSAAILSGARAARYPLLVTLDGDRQNDPADIPRLLTHLQNDNTVVLGHRLKRDDHLIRLYSSRIANGIRKKILQDECADTGCSLKIFSRKGFLSLPQFNHMHRFLPALFKRAGYLLISVPVNHRPRTHGQSKYGVMNRLFVGIYDLFGVRWLLKRPCLPEIFSDEH